MSKIIYKGLVEQNRLYEEQKKLNTQIDVFRRSGLDDAAKRLLPEYNKIVSEIKQHVTRIARVLRHRRLGYARSRPIRRCVQARVRRSYISRRRVCQDDALSRRDERKTMERACVHS